MKNLTAFFCCVLLLALQGAPCFATPSVDKNKPVYMQASQLGYDQQQAIVVAMGNVEVMQGATRLLADRITYYQNYAVVRADGNVRVTDDTGETYYADRVQLKDDLMAGVIGNFRARLSDNSQFTAAEARKLSATKTEMSKAQYTPCKVCEGKSPFWKIKADKIEVDDDKQRVYYDDVSLEMMGIPVAYSPYFFHPTPDAERKSGFLRPEYGQNSNLGTLVKAPYYVNISPDKDATITPIITSDEGVVMQGEYRQILNSGSLEMVGSGTYPDKRDASGKVVDDREFRGHLFAKGNYYFDENWASGFDLQRSTDDTYLNKYRYGNYKSLNSRAYTEGIFGRSYASIEALTFQGLQENDDPDLQPYVVPLAEAYYESDSGWHGSRFYGLANTQVVERRKGDNSRRLVTEAGWKVPHVTSSGQLIDVDARVRSDAYSIENTTLSSGNSFDGEKVRLVPQTSVKWRYPLINQFSDSSLTIEPTVLAVASSNGNNPEEITNEDNLIVEYSDVSLFSTDRLPGYDTVDNGSRVAYGTRGQWLLSDSKNLEFLVGQNYSVEEDSPYPYNSEAGENFSDYVGRLAFNMRPFTVDYRTRISQDDLHTTSNSVGMEFHNSPLDLRVNYVTLDEYTIDKTTFLEDRKEIMSSMAIALSDAWSINGVARRDIEQNQMLFAGTGLVYKNECFTLLTGLARTYTRDREVEPDTSFTVRVAFKNLNEL